MDSDDRPHRPPEDVVEASTPAQFRALAHPFRQRLLFSLGQRPATISQLAAALGVGKGSIAFHLKVLRDAEMVAIASTRTVRGGTEQYYQRTARRVVAPGNEPGPAAALLSAVGDEVATAVGEPLLTVRHLRLTATQAEQLAAALDRVVAGAQDAGDDNPRYGVLVTLYQQPDRPGGGTEADQ